MNSEVINCRMSFADREFEEPPTCFVIWSHRPHVLILVDLVADISFDPNHWPIATVVNVFKLIICGSCRCGGFDVNVIIVSEAKIRSVRYNKTIVDVKTVPQCRLVHYFFFDRVGSKLSRPIQFLHEMVLESLFDTSSFYFRPFQPCKEHQGFLHHRDRVSFIWR